MAELKIHVGEERAAMGARFIDAFRRAERGEDFAERHLSFDTFETMTRVLTPKRLELLRHLHRHPTASVAALSRAVKRDYKQVHEDVEAPGQGGPDRARNRRHGSDRPLRHHPHDDLDVTLSALAYARPTKRC